MVHIHKGTTNITLELTVFVKSFYEFNYIFFADLWLPAVARDFYCKNMFIECSNFYYHEARPCFIYDAL